MSAPAVLLRGAGIWTAGPPRVVLLQPIDWTVRAGEHWAVLGPNGAGKSTLLSLLAGTRHPSTGRAEILGNAVGRTDLRALRRRIGVVDAVTGQRLDGRLPVGQVVQTGLTGTVLPVPEHSPPDAADRADHALRAVGLGALGRRPFGACSQGERQRALLARALVGHPDLLLLDEAAAGLDLPAREAFIAALGAAGSRRPGLATVTVTHHVEELAPGTTHALLLRRGAAVRAGPVGSALADGPLSQAFELPVRVSRVDGRWSARAAAAWLEQGAREGPAPRGEGPGRPPGGRPPDSPVP